MFKTNIMDSKPSKSARNLQICNFPNKKISKLYIIQYSFILSNIIYRVSDLKYIFLLENGIKMIFACILNLVLN